MEKVREKLTELLETMAEAAYEQSVRNAQLAVLSSEVIVEFVRASEPDVSPERLALGDRLVVEARQELEAALSKGPSL